MSENSHQPKKDDAILGGQSPPPIMGAVLGGLAGVKHRLTHESPEIRIAALQDAVKYGQSGLELLAESLKDSEEKVQWTAYLLLRKRTPEATLKQIFQDNFPVIYQKLIQLLTSEKWQEADRETATAMLKLAGRETAGWLRVEDFNRFPSFELEIIDQLWVKYSNGRFGFSVQKQIRRSVANNYFAFGDRVGWRQGGLWLDYPSLNFTAGAPPGHLPAAHLTWGAIARSQRWMWYGGTEEDVRCFEVNALLSRREL